MAVRSHKRGTKKCRGMALIEVIMSIVLLVVSLVGLVAVFAMAVEVLNQSRQDSVARQEAQQFIEGIFAARNTGAITFANIQNVSQDATNGIFKDGMQPAYLPGADGMMNTADDLTMLETGPDGKPLTLQRQIVITPFLLATTPPAVDPNMREITITVQYGSGSQQRTYQQSTYISTYR